MLLRYQRCGESQGIFLFFYDFFLPHARFNTIKHNLARPTNAVGEGERAEGQRCVNTSGLVAGGKLKDFAAGVVFLFHVYTLPQMRQNTRIFLRLRENFFLFFCLTATSPHFLKKFEQAFEF